MCITSHLQFLLHFISKLYLNSALEEILILLHPMQAKDMYVIVYMPFQKEAAAALPFWGPSVNPGDIQGARGLATNNPALDRWRKKSKEAMLKSKAAAGMDHNYLLKTQFKKVSLFRILYSSVLFSNLIICFRTLICLVHSVW